MKDNGVMGLRGPWRARARYRMRAHGRDDLRYQHDLHDLRYQRINVAQCPVDCQNGRIEGRG